MDNLQSVSAALAALGYSSSSAPVYAARAAHHAAQLLYEAAEGELFVTVLVGQRRRPTSIILHLCDSVQQRLQPASWGTLSTAVKMLFYSFHAACENAPAQPGSAAGSAATGGGSVVATGTYPAGRSGELGGDAVMDFASAGQGGGQDDGGNDNVLGLPPAGSINRIPANLPHGSAPADGAPINGTGGPQAAPTPPIRRPQDVGGRRPATAAPAAPPYRHSLPDVPMMLTLPEMRGHEAADATPVVAPDNLKIIIIPAEFCAVTLASLRRHYTTDQKMVRNFCMVLMQCTKTLLGRLPSGSLRSRRSPTYIPLTPAAVTNAKIIYWDGGTDPTEITKPFYRNTGVANVPGTLALILYMAHQRSPLYLWLIDQFDAGVTVESGRRRKAAADPDVGASGGEGDGRGQPRRRLGTPGGGRSAAPGGASASVANDGASAVGGVGRASVRREVDGGVGLRAGFGDGGGAAACCRITRPSPRPLAGPEVVGTLGDANDVSRPGSDRWRCRCWVGS